MREIICDKERIGELGHLDMGIFPRISKESIMAAMNELSADAQKSVNVFIQEQPIMASAMIAICQSNDEFYMRMSAMALIYRALEKQTKL